ncbi:MAG: Ig-like domain-containing protein, partial [Marinoscillum sp.]
GEATHIRMVLDLTNDEYDVFAGPVGNTPVQIADGNNFHANPSTIDNLAGKYNTTTSGAQADICNIVIDGEAPASNPPTVSITAPSNNATVSGSSVSITASASDVDNDLTGVQFKLNGSNLGSQDTSSPFSYSWNTTGVSNGTYSLTAVATDDEGNSTTSSTVIVTVSNASGGSSPTVSITAPSNNSTVSNTVTITANASDSDSDLVGVQFKLDGNNLGSQDTSSPFSFSWDTNGASNGSHTLTAVATDAAGNSTTSSSVSVTVSNSSGSCFEVPNTNNWVNQSFTSQSSNFTIEFDVTVNENKRCDIGLSNGICDHENDPSGTIKFDGGKIVARNGQGWPSTNLPFNLNEEYHIKMVMDMTNETYDVFANKVGNAPSQIASDHNFHATPSSLDNLTGKFSTTTSGSKVDICNISVNSSGSRLAGAIDVEEIIAEETAMSVYPNPVADFLKISRPGKELEGNYIIRSISGAVISTGILSGERYDVKTSQLPTGVYILDVRLAGEAPKAIRIIKQ